MEPLADTGTRESACHPEVAAATEGPHNKTASYCKPKMFNHQTAWKIFRLQEIDLALRGPSAAARFGMTAEKAPFAGGICDLTVLESL